MVYMCVFVLCVCVCMLCVCVCACVCAHVCVCVCVCVCVVFFAVYWILHNLDILVHIPRTWYMHCTDGFSCVPKLDVLSIHLNHSLIAPLERDHLLPKKKRVIYWAWYERLGVCTYMYLYCMFMYVCAWHVWVSTWCVHMYVCVGGGGWNLCVGCKTCVLCVYIIVCVCTCMCLCSSIQMFIIWLGPWAFQIHTNSTAC